MIILLLDILLSLMQAINVDIIDLLEKIKNTLIYLMRSLIQAMKYIVILGNGIPIMKICLITPD